MVLAVLTPNNLYEVFADWVHTAHQFFNKQMLFQNAGAGIVVKTSAAQALRFRWRSKFVLLVLLTPFIAGFACAYMVSEVSALAVCTNTCQL